MRRKKRHIEGDVQLNMAAMLDMAFQLLAFFILTYQPGKVEGCIGIRMGASGMESASGMVGIDERRGPSLLRTFALARACRA